MHQMTKYITYRIFSLTSHDATFCALHNDRHITLSLVLPSKFYFVTLNMMIKNPLIKLNHKTKESNSWLLNISVEYFVLITYRHYKKFKIKRGKVIYTGCCSRNNHDPCLLEESEDPPKDHTILLIALMSSLICHSNCCYCMCKRSFTHKCIIMISNSSIITKLLHDLSLSR